ncbi:hypothetical protein ACTFQF_00505 [Aliivibrio fischeri]|uniref:Uncharacterized protein n=2 Tax=Aliivibrio fischeri TaxID=668 RepID=B5EVV8_ALIFM|nr:hypothetical protein [Aliivibrio fischeri]ACH64761.1 hypothetical protein VFMJ11_B0015 [Aliivibrio fischeri MJ11]MUK37536.1 hypothetical protein [Aliivibrio fischeri]
MKNIMMDESQRKPSFLRYTAVYGCGCAFMDDLWITEECCDKVCPEHKKNREFIASESIVGVRPEKSNLSKSPLRVSQDTIARLRD